MNQISKFIAPKDFKKTSLGDHLKGIQDLISESPIEGFLALRSLAVNLKQWYTDINLARCAILAIAEKNWDTFPLTETGEWDHDYYKFAKEFTGGYTVRSIDNMKRVGRTWLLKELPPDVPKKITLYDDYGNPVADKISGEIQVVEPDPYAQSFSKLLIATGAAHDGRFSGNEVALGQLFNPEVGVRELEATLQGRTNPYEGNKSEVIREVFFILDGPYLVARRGPEEALIAELNLEAMQGEFSVGTEGINKLKKALKV